MEEKKRKVKCSLILPIYNEEESIERFIKEFFFTFGELPIYELIIVDDNSSDKSREIIEKIIHKKKYIKLIKNSRRVGRGGSFKIAIGESRGEIVGYMDSDNQIDIENIRKAIKLIDNGYDMVVGERIEKNTKKIRRIFSVGFRIIAEFLRGLPSKDPLCGFKFFKRDKLLETIDKSRDNHWFFDFEIVEIFSKKSFQIADLPIIFWNYDKNHLSKTRLIFDSIYYMKKLLENEDRV